MEKCTNMNFNLLEKEDISQYTFLRDGEQKIGETILAGADYMLDNLKDCSAKFIVFGICEDVGPRANGGRGGSDTAWKPFMSKFLNIQETNELNGSSILMLGTFDFSDIEGYEFGSLKTLKKIVATIDDSISSIVEFIVSAGKIPIVIGGGHNNSYGLLKGSSKALGHSINCVNLDPHADYRKLEGRHSGNGFSYAKAEGFLDKYSIIGLHENYNSKEMIDRMENDLIDYSTFEAIFLRNEIDYEDAITISLTFVSASAFGIELDCDAIENFPSSAQTPTGISALQARKYIYQAARLQNATYLHIPEAAPALVENSEDQVGKLLSYLVSDFVRGNSIIN